MSEIIHIVTLKASPTATRGPTPELVLEAKHDVDGVSRGLSMEEMARRYRQEAAAIHVGLRRSLPQGLMYALLVEMLKGAPVFYQGPSEGG